MKKIQRFLRKLLHIVFSRTMITILMLLMQAAFLIVTFTILNSESQIILEVTNILAALLIIYIVTKQLLEIVMSIKC